MYLNTITTLAQFIELRDELRAERVHRGLGSARRFQWLADDGIQRHLVRARGPDRVG